MEATRKMSVHMNSLPQMTRKIKEKSLLGKRCTRHSGIGPVSMVQGGLTQISPQLRRCQMHSFWQYMRGPSLGCPLGNSLSKCMTLRDITSICFCLFFLKRDKMFMKYPADRLQVLSRLRTNWNLPAIQNQDRGQHLGG